jgi:hypothetical protein
MSLINKKKNVSCQIIIALYKDFYSKEEEKKILKLYFSHQIVIVNHDITFLL